MVWLDTEVPEEAKSAFSICYEVQNWTEERLDTHLQDNEHISVDTVVLTNRADKPSWLPKRLEKFGARLLDYDCRIIVLIPQSGNQYEGLLNVIRTKKLPVSGLPNDQMIRVGAWLPQDGEPPLPNVRVYDIGHSWKDIAAFSIDHPADEPHDPLIEIQPEELAEQEVLTKIQTLLIKRAFAQRGIRRCQKVYLSSIEDGRSGATVYRAHMRFEDSADIWSQASLIKIGPRDDIFKEYRTYEDNVTPYVPFHLGPNVIAMRCCLGASHGVIVGDYVEESESLKQCAADGRAAHAIACLFDRTLRGWYRRSEKENRKIGKTLSGTPTESVNDALTLLDSGLSLGQLNSIIQACDSGEWLVGPIHGDLHASNVRVRSTDAILIDFVAHKVGIILRDVARLEVSLLVDCLRDEALEGSDEGADTSWLQGVEPLYSVMPTSTYKLYEDPKNEYFWFHTCVRQIRLQARQFELSENQYAVALAYELLVKALRKDSLTPRQAFHRAAAFYFAELVLRSTFPTAVSTASTAA